MAHCPGVSTPIEDEEPLDFYLFIVDSVKSFEDEMTKDRSIFFAEDLVKYDLKCELLADSILLKSAQQLVTSINPAGHHELLKYRYQKSMCQEMHPGRDNSPYGEPYEHYQLLGEAEFIDISPVEFRQEWRAFMDSQGFKLKEGQELAQIGSLHERKMERFAHLEERQKRYYDGALRRAKEKREKELEENPQLALEPAEIEPEPLAPPPDQQKFGMEVHQDGEGYKIQRNDIVRAHYTGKLLDGTKFDSNLDNGDEPFEFTFGRE